MIFIGTMGGRKKVLQMQGFCQITLVIPTSTLVIWRHIWVFPKVGRSPKWMVSNGKLVGGWTNPFEKYSSKWVLPQIGVNIKNIWNHHPENPILELLIWGAHPYFWKHQYLDLCRASRLYGEDDTKNQFGNLQQFRDSPERFVELGIWSYLDSYGLMIRAYENPLVSLNKAGY